MFNSSDGSHQNFKDSAAKVKKKFIFYWVFLFEKRKFMAKNRILSKRILNVVKMS
jgi:hypothetical protein